MHSSHTRRKSRTPLLAGFSIVLILSLVYGAREFSFGPWSTKQVSVYVDDALVVETRTQAKTVADVLVEAGVTLGEADLVTPTQDQPVTDGMKIEVVRAQTVLLLVDGSVKEVAMQSGTVQDALVIGAIRMGPLDRVVPVRETPIHDGMEINVIRVTQEEVVETDVIPYATTRWAEPHLPVGERRIVREGQEGILKRVYLLTYENGELAHRKLLRTEVERNPVDEIIGIGTREARQVLQTATGTYHYTEVLDMEATAYYPGPESTGEWADGYTYTGLLAGKGVVAVDPTVIPLGTRLYIPGYGEAIAADIGGAIKGYRIDLGFATYEEAIQYGRQKVKVYVLAD